MIVSLSLNQVTSIQPGPLYRVVNTVTAGNDTTDPAVFVYKTATQTFDHYAAVADMEVYPNSYAAASEDNIPFYRLPTTQRDWPTVFEMQKDLTYTISRLQSLADSLSVVNGSVIIDQTTVISAGS